MHEEAQPMNKDEEIQTKKFHKEVLISKETHAKEPPLEEARTIEIVIVQEEPRPMKTIYEEEQPREEEGPEIAANE